MFTYETGRRGMDETRGTHVFNVARTARPILLFYLDCKCHVHADSTFGVFLGLQANGHIICAGLCRFLETGNALLERLAVAAFESAKI